MTLVITGPVVAAAQPVSEKQTAATKQIKVKLTPGISMF
jgi:hypothetical protein